MQPEGRATGRFRLRGWDVLRLALGVLLLTAAVLKLMGRNLSAMPSVGWFGQPWVQLAVAEWEIVLALWLLSGWCQLGGWLAAIGTFAAFAGVSGYLGWQGVPRCACFGPMKANPWWVFGLDVSLTAIILMCRPSVASHERIALADARQLALAGLQVALSTAVILAIISIYGLVEYGSMDVALARLRGERLALDQSSVDFGVGAPGETLQAIVRIRNCAERPITIVGGTSDCSCTTTKGLPVTIQPSAIESLSIYLNVKTSDPGLFSRTAQFWTDDEKQPIIYVHVRCMVR